MRAAALGPEDPRWVLLLGAQLPVPTADPFPGCLCGEGPTGARAGPSWAADTECGGRGRRSRGRGPSPGKGGSASPVGEDWGLLPHSPEHVPLSTTELTRQRRTYPEPPRRSPSRVLCSGGGSAQFQARSRGREGHFPTGAEFTGAHGRRVSRPISAGPPRLQSVPPSGAPGPSRTQPCAACRSLAVRPPLAPGCPALSLSSEGQASDPGRRQRWAGGRTLGPTSSPTPGVLVPGDPQSSPSPRELQTL